YYNAVTGILTIIYSIAFGTGILCCTFSGYLIVSDNNDLKVKFTGLCCVILLHLFVICWVAEATTNELLSLGNTIYSLEWYHLPKECQSTLRLMLMKASQPLYYYLIFGQRVDIEAYMSLVKASYYYINMMTAK
ncbi:Odorant receptor 111, partial [Halyomorpha halys]